MPTADSPGYATAEWGPYLGADVGVLEVGDFRDQYTLKLRDLFDFFDANGVYLAINTALYGERIFYAQMWLDKLVWLSEEYPTRAAAEAAAFGAAFEKLEEMLGKEGK